MRKRLGLIGTLLAAALATSACAAAKPGPALHCRHPLASVGSPDQLPGGVVAQVKPWMALHGERWNDTDSISQGDLTAGFLWAARSAGDWLVVFKSGGIACCHTRFVLLRPAAAGSASYQMALPPSGAPDYFGDASCKGLDAALDAYGTRAWR